VLLAHSWPTTFGRQSNSVSTRYVWFGADRPFACMTFLLADGGHGLLGAHVYPYSPMRSTFLVEAPAQVWRESDFTADDLLAPGRTDERLLSYCQEVFADDLDGATLIGTAPDC